VAAEGLDSDPLSGGDLLTERISFLRELFRNDEGVDVLTDSLLLGVAE
jgi:hypothetical protein